MNSPGHLIWIILGALVGFGSSFIFGDLLTLPVDLYYLIYFGIIITFFSIYIRKTHLNPKEWFFKEIGIGSRARNSLWSFDGEVYIKRAGD